MQNELPSMSVAPQYRDALRRLMLNDEDFFNVVVARNSGAGRKDDALASTQALDDRTRRLLDIAAVIALGGEPNGIDAATRSALDAGASPEDVVEVLLDLAPILGRGRVAAAAGPIATAIGYDVWLDFEEA